jgi:hypothetical protein
MGSRYQLAAGGIHPDRDVSLIIPAAQTDGARIYP